MTTPHTAAEILRAANEGARDWFVWSNKWGAWHCPNFHGYTSHISRAGRFTHEEAMGYHDADPKLRKHGNEARHLSEVRGTIDATIRAKREEHAAEIARLNAHLSALAEPSATPEAS